MRMHNPPHPGAFIRRTYTVEHNLTTEEIARGLKVAQTLVDDLLAEKVSITPDLALRLSKVLGLSAHAWLKMQADYDLFQIRDEHADLRKLDLIIHEDSEELQPA